MRFLFSILLSVIGSRSIYARTRNDSLVQAAAIADGLFFDKSVPTKTLVPGGSTITVIKSPDSTMVIGIYLPEGYTLEESMIAKAIPTQRVRYAEKLLRDYNEHKPQTVATYEGIGVKVGEPMIEFEYSDIDNNIWNNEKLKEKIYVLNIWQSECGPCRKEMPILSEWKERFPEVVFLSASRHNKEEILPIVERHNLSWIHLRQASDLVALVRQQGFPLTIVVDKKGIVRFAKVGATEENQSEALTIIQTLTH